MSQDIVLPHPPAILLLMMVCCIVKINLGTERCIYRVRERTKSKDNTPNDILLSVNWKSAATGCLCLLLEQKIGGKLKEFKE